MSTGWTYGAELELSDWPRGEVLPVRGMGIDLRDVTMVNSCGVAVDPRGRAFWLGGEIQTAPTDAPEGQADQLAEIMRRWPQTTVNYRSNLHVHVRVPGLRENLAQLKRVQWFVYTTMPAVLPVIEPIPEPYAWPDKGARQGARARWARRKVSHQKLISTERVNWQMSARTPEEFRDREYMDPVTKRLHPAIHPRACVNLRQLWETDTVEFRHFPGTTRPEELRAAVRWCGGFMRRALGLEEEDVMVQAHNYATHRWLPRFEDYDHWLEEGYQATCVKHVGRFGAPEAAAQWISSQRHEIERRGAPV